MADRLVFICWYAGLFTGTVAFAQNSTPVIAASGGVVNAASLKTGIAGNTWISIFGENLASTSRQWQAADIQEGRLPIELDGTGVLVNGKPAYISYISPRQINALTPLDDALGSIEVVVTRSGTRSRSVLVTKTNVSPELFRFGAADQRYAAATHADGSYLGSTTLYPGLTRPARRGDVIVLYANGLGSTDPPISDGRVITQTLKLSTNLTVRFGNAAADVRFAGLTATGLYQLNVQVPETVADGDIAVSIEMGGVRSQDAVFVSIGDGNSNPPAQSYQLGPITVSAQADLRIERMADPYASDLQRACPTCKIPTEMLALESSDRMRSFAFRYQLAPEHECLHRDEHNFYFNRLRPLEFNVWADRIDATAGRILMGAMPRLPGLPPAAWGLLTRCDNGAYVALEFAVNGDVEAGVNRAADLIASIQIRDGSLLVGDWAESGDRAFFGSDGRYSFRVTAATGFDSSGTYTRNDRRLVLNQETGIGAPRQRECEITTLTLDKLVFRCNDGITSSYNWRLH